MGEVRFGTELNTNLKINLHFDGKDCKTDKGNNFKDERSYELKSTLKWSFV